MPVRVLVPLVVVAVVLAIPFVGYRLQPARDMHVLLVDKSVPTPAGEGHALWFWFLDHNKWYPPGRPWSAGGGYLGFDPATCKGEEVTPARLRGNRLAYVADTYGIYVDDYALGVPWTVLTPCLQRAARAHYERPFYEAPTRNRVYGGVSLAEAEALRDFRRRGGSVAAEFATIEVLGGAAPGPDDATLDVLAETFGAVNERWEGRWYDDLDDGDVVPQHIFERWDRHHREAWPYRGPGFILFGTTDERLEVVLPDEFTRRDAALTIEVPRHRDPLVEGVRDGVPLWTAFSGTRPASGARVVAWFQWHVRDSTRARLRRAGFPLRFPAVTRAAGEPVGAYLSAAFTDFTERLPRMRTARWLDPAQRLVAAYNDAPGREDDFVWNVAFPLWRNLVQMAQRPGGP